MKYQKEEVAEMLLQSNYIENERSVQAYADAIEAWNFAVTHKDCIDLYCVLGIHERLCKNIAPDIAGEVRDCDVYIGGHRKIFVSKPLIEEDIRVVLEKVNFTQLLDSMSNLNFIDQKKLNKKKEKVVKHCHVAFENVHPFVDGNGRTGRILYNIHRLNLGLPIHIIHEGEEQMEYYKWFK